MTALTLSEEERDQIIKALELGADWYEQGHVDMGGVMDNIEDNDIRDAIALLTRYQAPEVCECVNGPSPHPLWSDEHTKHTCWNCGKRIKETTNER
jgi:hypothetical protein